MNDEFVDQDLLVTEESKAFIHDLIEKINFILDNVFENVPKKLKYSILFLGFHMIQKII